MADTDAPSPNDSSERVLHMTDPPLTDGRFHDPGALLPSTSTSTSAPPPSSNTTTVPPKPVVDAHGRTLNPRSCVTCRKRKVKCDKTHPCANCRRAHIECVFPSPGRAPRKARKGGDGRDRELIERLRRLEGVVKGLGVEMPGEEGDKEGDKEGERGMGGDEEMAGEAIEERAAGESVPGENGGGRAEMDGRSNGLQTDGGTKQRGNSGMQETDFKARSEWMQELSRRRLDNRFGRLVINEGRSRYINNSFWANLSNEVEDLKGILNQSSDEEDPTTPNSHHNSSGHHQGYVFGFSSQNVDMLSLHPLPHQIAPYWQVFRENVDPLAKVLHVPTIEPNVLSAASHLSHLSRGFEALLFSIYYGAVTSLSPQDCLAKFGEEKPLLLSRYRFAIEQALARASFLVTEQVIVLQAFVIFLICLRRNNDARVIWTLTGLVVRIAQTLGVHRDGVHFGLSPFEIETRRRLWWQVCILDTRASEDHGCDPTIIEQAFDTKMPLNINDIDITPSMKDFPPERQGCTDMSFCLIRFEVTNTFRRINYTPPAAPHMCQETLASITLQDKERWITECHQRLEERYLKHCDMTVPLFWVTATVARLMMSKMWLMVYHPFQRQDGGATLPAETKDKLFITSLENMEYSILLETEARTMKWGWLFKTYMQWHALAFILSELCHRTTGDLVERAWVAVEKTRDGRWGEVTDDEHYSANSRGYLWRPLKKLYRKASEARRHGLQEEVLLKQRAFGQAPARTYSPNANPMFGHPQRPTVVRAPLSRAQLQRFTQGPMYGERPLDSHEMLKSPRLRMLGEGEVELMDIGGGAGTLAAAQERRVSGAARSRLDGDGVLADGGTHLFSPQARQGDAGVFANPANGVDFGAMDLSNPDGASTSLLNNTTASNAAITGFPPSTSDPTAVQRASSFGSSFDPLMDTSGDLMNWESWDQLVRQIGMDVDSGADFGAVGESNGWDGAGWDGDAFGPDDGRAGMAMGGENIS